RVRPHQFVPHPRELLRVLPDRQLAGAVGVHRHRHAVPGAARDHRDALPYGGPAPVPPPPVGVHPRRPDGAVRRPRRRRRAPQPARSGPLREAHAGPRSLLRRTPPAWLLGLVPLLLAVGLLGAFAVLGGPGLGDRPGPPVEELSIERTVLEPN